MILRIHAQVPPIPIGISAISRRSPIGAPPVDDWHPSGMRCVWGDVTGGAPNGDRRLIAWTPTGVRTKSGTLIGTYGTGRPLVTAPISLSPRHSTWTLLVHRHDDYHWALLLNTRKDRQTDNLMGRLDRGLHEAADSVKEWPEVDQFSTYIPLEAPFR